MWGVSRGVRGGGEVRECRGQTGWGASERGGEKGVEGEVRKGIERDEKGGGGGGRVGGQG